MKVIPIDLWRESSLNSADGFEKWLLTDFVFLRRDKEKSVDRFER